MIARERLRAAGVVFIFLWFFIGGLGHFVSTAFFMQIVPPWFPWPLFAVLASGVAELLLVALWTLPRWRHIAGWGLIAVIIAVTPANVQMWLHPEQYPILPQWAYALRLVIQAALIWLVWWSARRGQSGIQRT